MSEQPKKRPWLQFHLSTLIVLMLISASLMYVNFTESIGYWHWGEEVYEANVVQEYRGYGWPMTCMRQMTGKAHYDDGTPYQQSLDSSSWRKFNAAIVGNAFFAVAVLGASWILCEYLIRRKEHKS